MLLRYYESTENSFEQIEEFNNNGTSVITLVMTEIDLVVNPEYHCYESMELYYLLNNIGITRDMFKQIYGWVSDLIPDTPLQKIDIAVPDEHIGYVQTMLKMALK